MKKYQSGEVYEKKLKNVMARMGVTGYSWDWGRKTCFVEFVYKGKEWRFENSVEASCNNGFPLEHGSDAFAVVVLDLESIARMMEHGTFDLEAGEIRGLKQLPAHGSSVLDFSQKSSMPLPDCFKILQFDHIPTETSEINDRFKSLIKSAHPDVGGLDERFQVLLRAKEEAIGYLRGEAKKS